MKSFIALSVLLFATKSFALCNQFNGNWSCGGKSTSINVVQQDGQEVLKASFDMIVDGQRHEQTVQGFMNLAYTVTCTADTLEIALDQLDGNGGEALLKSVQKFTVKGGSLALTATIDNGMGLQTVNMTCRK